MLEDAWHDAGVDDRALVEASLDGDREAFGTLVDRETPSVYRSVLRVLRDPAEAEDVAQETFVTAYRSLAGFRGEGTPRAWLIRIGTRIAFRRLARRRPTIALDDVPAARLASPDADPAGITLAAERASRVRDAVARLPDSYRETVALRFFGELSLQEIAEATGRPVNTVKTHLRRGLERLRHLVGEPGG